jgi:hypothetical protein
MSTEELLIKEGYPVTVPMTRSNLANIIDRYTKTIPTEHINSIGGLPKLSEPLISEEDFKKWEQSEKLEHQNSIEEAAEDAWNEYEYEAQGSLYGSCYKSGFIAGATSPAAGEYWKQQTFGKPCSCTPDETTGWITAKCCNICGKYVDINNPG